MRCSGSQDVEFLHLATLQHLIIPLAVKVTVSALKVMRTQIPTRQSQHKTLTSPTFSS